MVSFDWLQFAVASYAALVGTAAIALEIRPWLESGPRLSIHCMLNAKTMGMQESNEKEFIYFTVSNRGDLRTTLTRLVMFSFDNYWKKFDQEKNTVIVPNPTIPGWGPGLPFVLKPGEVWNGFVLQNEDADSILKEGMVRGGVCASHQQQPILIRIKVK